MKIGILGTGKISSTVVEAICTSSLEDYKIFVSPRNEFKSKNLEKRFSNVSRSLSNQDVVNNSDIIFIALKPDIYEDVLDDLFFRKEHQIVSLIPFASYSRLKELVDPAENISRATPLPTVVNHLCPIQVYRPNDKVLKILGNIGQVLVVETEEQLHTIWTLTCLISPYYELMSELSEWAVRNKVDKKIADKYVADMFASLALAASKSNSPDFNLLSSHAATPGGLNEKTALRIKESGAHKAYSESADYVLKLFKETRK